MIQNFTPAGQEALRRLAACAPEMVLESLGDLWEEQLKTYPTDKIRMTAVAACAIGYGEICKRLLPGSPRYSPTESAKGTIGDRVASRLFNAEHMLPETCAKIGRMVDREINNEVCARMVEQMESKLKH